MYPLLGFNCYVSYRDPNIKSTYDAYEEIPQVVSSLELNHRELEQLIIRTYGNFDPLLNPFAKALRGRNQALSSIPESYLTQFGNEIRHTTATFLIVDLKLDPLTVSQRLRHADRGFTLNQYAHLYVKK